ncbi:putative disease resistance protein [Prunus yedoensis var. nudiflora]|uniref:Putative disease resistance protein n=1 Tax=Prunus yedoensis var. nudiflora TaxID=2094558 RepID=A0A314XWN1_PRUYE|nr:putative disease resistance protein [Prunus yedoensis var. nudiflora]
MRSLMNSTTLDPNRPVLEKLEKLYVIRLNLKKLCIGDLPHGSLSNLKLLEVKKCVALKGTLLQPNLWQKLQNLEVLNIEDMHCMEYVFQPEGVEQEQTVFRKLREMKLAKLDELKSIWNGPAQCAIFHNLKVLTVSDCNKLKSIFTTDAAQCLLQLEELLVYDCSSLKTVIKPSEGTLEEKIIIPQLRHILLRRLRELKSFYSGGSGSVECPSLEHLNVLNCPQFLMSTSDFHSQKQDQANWYGPFSFAFISLLDLLNDSNIHLIIPGILREVRTSNSPV